MNPTRDTLHALLHEFATSRDHDAGAHLTATLELLDYAADPAGLYVLERVIAECTNPHVPTAAA